MGQRDAKRAAAAGERTPTPIAEQWAYLRFLGFGAWWAWIWLCYNSTEIMRMFPAGVQTSSVLQMYLFSTAGIAGSMFVAACAWKTLTRLIDRRAFVVGVSALASLFTLLLGFSVIMGAGPFFISAALLTGVGTSVLCLKAGRIYGSISLGDSLTAGGISLLFAAFLYFVGVGIPPELRLFFIAALPLISALLLTMGNPDPFQAADDNAGESVARGSFEWRAYRKLVAAAAIVAFTAGVGKGIASMIGNVDLFARSGTITVFCVGLIAVAIVAVVNRGDAVRGARSVYSGLIVLGIAMMLATCFGFDISFLSIGKECLWMVFSCFMAYLAFRYDFSVVRVFGIGFHGVVGRLGHGRRAAAVLPGRRRAHGSGHGAGVSGGACVGVRVSGERFEADHGPFGGQRSGGACAFGGCLRRMSGLHGGSDGDEWVDGRRGVGFRRVRGRAS